MPYSITFIWPDAPLFQGKAPRPFAEAVGPHIDAAMQGLLESARTAPGAYGHSYPSVSAGFSMGPAEVGPSSYARSITHNWPVFWPFERGSSPHMPPWKPGTRLWGWAARMGLPAYGVARTIQAQGTPAHRVMDKAWAAHKASIKQAVFAGIRSYISGR